MRLRELRVANFQSFGEEPQSISLERMTFLLGHNGAGKTTVLQALVRLFGLDPGRRRIKSTDFHVSSDLSGAEESRSSELWIEAEFEIPEINDVDNEYPSIPAFFLHARLESKDDAPLIRFRLTATLDEDDVSEKFEYVTIEDDNGEPVGTGTVSAADRARIQVHYVPARRDPADHISYAGNTLIGRTLRASKWGNERDSVGLLAKQIGEQMAATSAISDLSNQMAADWGKLHSGQYLSTPSIAFEGGNFDKLLEGLSVGFTPTHASSVIGHRDLSDGHKSLLYVSLVISVHSIGRKVLAAETDAFDIDKLRPAAFTIIAIEEPENSLSPHYLGRVIRSLRDFAGAIDAQAVISTHSPSLLKRVDPSQIRYLRLGANRTTSVKVIPMPAESSTAFKFVREAVQAYPELYFSRLVVLGEGDSEEIVLPRLMEAMGFDGDETSVSVVPLGGRHVNHFWRLLHALEIPHVTLLDLDLARHQGGWGRLRYATKQLKAYSTSAGVVSRLDKTDPDALPKWDTPDGFLENPTRKGWLKFLEGEGVFFSSLLDLDFGLIRSFPGAYGVVDSALIDPDEKAVVSVLGVKHGDPNEYGEERLKYFAEYHRVFKVGSKPVSHLSAMANLSDQQLLDGMPRSLKRMLTRIQSELASSPE